MTFTIKIQLEYICAFNTAQTHEYRILKITGAPNVEVMDVPGKSYQKARVGALLSERQAEELATRHEVTTTRNNK